MSDDAQSYSPFAEIKLSVDDDPENQTDLFMGEDIDDLMDEHFADLNTSLKNTYLEIDEQAVNNNNNIRNNWQDSLEDDFSESVPDNLVNEMAGETGPVLEMQFNQHQPESASFTKYSPSPQPQFNFNSSS
ncbi:hypothetical protein MEO94_34305, partial [Dolichospermum sp. ST_sed9]|nr:hypothetical protein [Dolichospermum sp. ST_sed9]